MPVIKIKEMHEGYTPDTEYVSANIDEKNIVNTGDILFSWSATLEVLYWLGTKGGLNQHIFKVVPKNYFTKEYVFSQLSAYIGNFIKIAQARKTTMGHITTDHLKQSYIVIPPKELVEKYTEKVAPLHERIRLCSNEILELTKMRNGLLQQLMMGEVVVK